MSEAPHLRIILACDAYNSDINEEDHSKDFQGVSIKWVLGDADVDVCQLIQAAPPQPPPDKDHEEMIATTLFKLLQSMMHQDVSCVAAVPELPSVLLGDQAGTYNTNQPMFRACLSMAQKLNHMGRMDMVVQLLKPVFLWQNLTAGKCDLQCGFQFAEALLVVGMESRRLKILKEAQAVNEQLYRQVLESKQQEHDQQHQSQTAGVSYTSQDEARACQGLARCSSALGDNATSLQRWHQAVYLEQLAAGVQQPRQGEHMGLALAMEGEAEAHMRLRQYPEARVTYRQLLTYWQGSRFSRLNDVLRCMLGLAHTYIAQERQLPEAESLIQYALLKCRQPEQEQAEGVPPQTHVLAMQLLSSLMDVRHRHTEALDLKCEVFRLSTAHFGTTHPRSLVLLGHINDHLTNHPDTVSPVRSRQLLTMLQTELGPDHPDLIPCLEFMTTPEAAQCDPEAVKHLVRLQQLCLPPGDVRLLHSLVKLLKLHTDPEDQLSVLQQVLSWQEQHASGADKDSIISSVSVQMAKLLFKLKRNEEAVPHLRRAAELSWRPNQPQTQTECALQICKRLAECLEDTGELEQAAHMYLRVMSQHAREGQLYKALRLRQAFQRCLMKLIASDHPSIEERAAKLKTMCEQQEETDDEEVLMAVALLALGISNQKKAHMLGTAKHALGLVMKSELMARPNHQGIAEIQTFLVSALCTVGMCDDAAKVSKGLSEWYTDLAQAELARQADENGRQGGGQGQGDTGILIDVMIAWVKQQQLTGDAIASLGYLQGAVDVQHAALKVLAAVWTSSPPVADMAKMVTVNFFQRITHSSFHPVKAAVLAIDFTATLCNSNLLNCTSSEADRVFTVLSTRLKLVAPELRGSLLSRLPSHLAERAQAHLAELLRNPDHEASSAATTEPAGKGSGRGQARSRQATRLALLAPSAPDEAKSSQRTDPVTVKQGRRQHAQKQAASKAAPTAEQVAAAEAAAAALLREEQEQEERMMREQQKKVQLG